MWGLGKKTSPEICQTSQRFDLGLLPSQLCENKFLLKSGVCYFVIAYLRNLTNRWPKYHGLKNCNRTLKCLLLLVPTHLPCLLSLNWSLSSIKAILQNRVQTSLFLGILKWCNVTSITENRMLTWKKKYQKQEIVQWTSIYPTLRFSICSIFALALFPPPFPWLCVCIF